MAHPKVVAVALLGLLAAAGTILGASVQEERVRSTDPADLDQGAAAGNLVALTGLLTATAAASIVSVLSRTPWRVRAPASLGVGLATFLLVQLVQAGFPNYLIIEDLAVMSLTLFANNTQGGAAVMGPVLVLAFVIIAGWVHWMRRLFIAPRPAEPARAHSAWTLAAVPLLAAGAWGPLEVLLSLPAGSRQAGAHSILLALQFAGLAALLAAHVAADRALRRACAEPRLSDWAIETVRQATLIQLAIGGGILLLAAAGAFLAPLDLEILHAGFTLGTNLRVHHLLQPLLLLPLLPALRHRREALALLPTAPTPGRTSTVPATLAFVAAGVVLLPTQGALWPWLAAAVPPLLWAWPFAHRAQTTQALWSAYILWAFGNTITAAFRHGEDISIRFDTSPGVSALWQLVALLVGGAALARAAAASARGPRTSTPGTLGFLLAGLLAVTLWLELPLAAWQINTLTGEGVAIGSLPSSQDPPVRAIMHSAAALGMATVPVLAARLHRPEWFGRPVRPAPGSLPTTERATSARRSPAGAAAGRSAGRSGSAVPRRGP